MDYGDVIARLKAEANPANVAGMARYGISTTNTTRFSELIARTPYVSRGS